MNRSDREFPAKVLKEWQGIVDLLARIAGVRVSLIMRAREDDIEVFVSSATANNPYHVGDHEVLLNSNLYCETVIQQQDKLYVPNALSSEQWKANPDLKYGMICYLGFPIRLPDGAPFGTICLLDDQPGDFSADISDLVEKMRDLIEGQLAMLEENRLERLFASESLARKMLDNIPTAIGCCNPVPGSKVLYLNQQFVELFGYTLNDIPTVDAWLTAMVPDGQYRAEITQNWKTAIERAKMGEGKVTPAEFQVARKDGQMTNVLIGIKVLDDLLLISFVDITQQKQAESDLRNIKDQLEATLDTLPDLMFRLDRNGTFLDCHAMDSGRYFVSPEEFLGKRIVDIFPVEASQVMMAALEDANKTGSHHGTIYSLPTPTGTGWYQHSIAKVEGRSGQEDEFITLIRDVTRSVEVEQELREANAELARLAITDSLTGVWNRRYIEDFVKPEMAQSQRYGQPLSLILMDIDHFKMVNDHFGHKAGDRVLIDLSRRVQHNLRAADQLARWGGEEFLIVTPHCGGAEAMRLAEKLRAVIAGQPFEGAGVVTASFGAAQWMNGETLDAWFRRADRALYAAKSAGRNAVSLAP